VSDGPQGLVVSDRFAEYLQTFRDRYPLDSELAISTVYPPETEAPNPTVNSEVTIDEWNAADFSGPLQYYDDAGDAAQLPASPNASNDNPVTLTATDIDFQESNEFPRLDAEDGENSARRSTIPEWTVDERRDVSSSTTTAPARTR